MYSDSNSWHHCPCDDSTLMGRIHSDLSYCSLLSSCGEGRGERGKKGKEGKGKERMKEGRKRKKKRRERAKRERKMKEEEEQEKKGERKRKKQLKRRAKSNSESEKMPLKLYHRRPHTDQTFLLANPMVFSELSRASSELLACFHF